MPAAAVIPAPIAYIKVAAVKKLVVGFLTKLLAGPPRQCVSAGLAFVIRSNDMRAALHWVGAACFRSFTLKKLECFKQACFAMNTLAWNNNLGLSVLFCWCSGAEVMIDRDSWGC